MYPRNFFILIDRTLLVRLTIHIDETKIISFPQLVILLEILCFQLGTS